MFRASYPLMLNHLLATIYYFLDVPLLQQFKGDEAVGWYDSAYKYIKAFNIIPSFFTFALFPVISRQVKESLTEARFTFRLSVKLLVLTALPLAAATTLMASFLIGLLGGGEFLPDGATALRLIVWSIPIGWINSVTNYVLIALGQERRLTRAFLIGVSFNLITNIIFIPLYSYKAAAITTIASELVLLLVFNYYLVRSMPDIGWNRLLRKPVAAAVIMAAAILAANLVSPWVALVAGLSAYAVALWRLGIFGRRELVILSDLVPARLRRYVV
jgi:O-antigen/teichoic acid export membrane protein